MNLTSLKVSMKVKGKFISRKKPTRRKRMRKERIKEIFRLSSKLKKDVSIALLKDKLTNTNSSKKIFRRSTVGIAISKLTHTPF